jgi:hypothetical protein
MTRVCCIYPSQKSGDLNANLGRNSNVSPLWQIMLSGNLFDPFVLALPVCLPPAVLHSRRITYRSVDHTELIYRPFNDFGKRVRHVLNVSKWFSCWACHPVRVRLVIHGGKHSGLKN